MSGEWEPAGLLQIRRGGCVDLKRNPPPGEGGLPYILHCTLEEWAAFVDWVKRTGGES